MAIETKDKLVTLEDLKASHTYLKSGINDLDNDKADIIISSASGAIASFSDGADGLPVKDLGLTINTYQNTHGLGSPYPPGGSKNKLPLNLATIKALNTDGTWNGNVYSRNGVDFDVGADNGGNVIYISAVGTARSGGASIILAETDYAGYLSIIQNQSSKLVGCPANGSSASYYQIIYGNLNGERKNVRDYGSGVSLDTNTFDSSIPSGNNMTFTYRCYINADYNAKNVVFTPMILSAADAQVSTVFVPYSNICPISGYTGLNILYGGKDLLKDVRINQNYYINASGSLVKATTSDLSSTDYIKVSAGDSLVICTDFQLLLTNAISIAYFQSNKVFIRRDYVVSSQFPPIGRAFFEITVPDNVGYIIVNCSYSGFSSMKIVENIGILPITFPSSAGTVYGGTLDVTTGVLTVTWVSETIPTVESVIVASYGVTYAFIDTSYNIKNDLTKAVVICERAKGVAFNDRGQAPYVAYYAEAKKFALRADQGTTLQEFNDLYAGSKFVYELASSQSYQLDPATLTTLLGENNIWHDANGNTSVEYRADTGLYINGNLVEKAAINDLDNDKADAITDTASGSIASFSDGADGLLVKSLVLDIEPSQILRGQDAPYPAGSSAQVWDEEWELGKLNTTTGENATDNTSIRAKNYIPVVGGNTYYFICPENSWFMFYDSNKVLLTSGLPSGTQTAANARRFKDANITMPSDCSYVRFYVISTYGKTYNFNISLNYPASDQDYHPYANICPISGHTGVLVQRFGENIWPERTLMANYIDGLFAELKEDGHIVVKGTATKTGAIRLQDASSISLPAGTYYRSECATPGLMLVRVGSTSVYDNPFTLTQESSVSLLFEYSANEVIDVDLFPAICRAEAMPEILPITFPFSAGTVYGGTLDVTTGVLTVISKNKNLSSDTSIWNTSGNVKYATISDLEITDAKKAPSGGKTNGLMCNMALSMTWSDCGSYDNGIIITYNDYLGISKAVYDSLIGGADVQICYELASPQSYQLTAQQLNTLLGENNIWADCGPILNCEYRADTKLYIEKLTQPTEDDMTANSNIASGTFFMVGNSLYLSTAAILAGDPIKPGTNCTALSLADALNNLNA